MGKGPFGGLIKGIAGGFEKMVEFFKFVISKPSLGKRP